MRVKVFVGTVLVGVRVRVYVLVGTVFVAVNVLVGVKGAVDVWVAVRVGVACGRSSTSQLLPR